MRDAAHAAASLLVSTLVLVSQSPPGAPPDAAIVLVPLDRPDDRWHLVQGIDDGVRAGAARFDGGRARIDVGPCAVDSSLPFTLRCHLRTTTSGFCTPLMARDGEAVGLSLVLGRSPGRLSFEAWSWQSVRIATRERIDDGAWHAIEATYDPASTIALLFVDGVLQGHAELGIGGSPTARLRLGNNIGADQPFAGDLDEVSIERTTSNVDRVRELAPVLSLERREAALHALRGELLPKVTPSLTEAAAANWLVRRAQVRQHVADALGLSPPPPTVPLDVQVHGELVRDGVRLQRLSWVGFPGRRATGWLWLPAHPKAGRRPAVLCPHGHWDGGATHPVVQARCAAMAQFGWNALAIDSVHVEDVASGVNAVGAMTWHNQRAIDLLLQRDDVDVEQLAVTGASGGAQQSYYLMALEERLAAAAPMVMACYLAEIVDDTSAHCGCNHVPRLAARTDVPEMCAVFAPRPVMFGSVTDDWTRNFPREGLPELAAHWPRLGGIVPRSRHAQEGHNFDRPMREEVYGFLHDVLLGPAADGQPRTRVAEPGHRLFSMAELRGLLQLCAPCKLSSCDMATEYLARRPKVDSLAALAPGLDLRVAARALEWAEADANADDGALRRATVRSNDGVPIPLRMRKTTPAPSEPFTLVVDVRGTAVAVDGPAWLRELPHPVYCSPRPYGEWARFRSAWQRNGIFLGRGEGYQAALDTALVAASLPGDAAVHIVGLGEAGVVAVLAAHLCPRIVRVVVDDVGENYAENGNRLPLCPELLRCRDLPAWIDTLPRPCTFERRSAPR